MAEIKTRHPWIIMQFLISDAIENPELREFSHRKYALESRLDLRFRQGKPSHYEKPTLEPTVVTRLE